MTNSPKTVHFLPELEAATGKFDFPMTNDYMFRAVLQSNNKALTGLISSLLHIPPEDISSVEVTNSIFRMNADDMARKRCRDREEHYRELRGLRKRIEEKDAQIEEKDAQIKELGAENEEQAAKIEEQAAEIARLQKQLESDNK